MKVKLPKKNRFTFRIWDISAQEFMIPKRVFLTSKKYSGYVVLYQGKYNITSLDWAMKNTQDFIVQQFTGLKDENGREIYEGDVVVYNEYPHINLFVRYDAPNFVFTDGDMGHWAPLMSDDFSDCKVVGTIFDKK